LVGLKLTWFVNSFVSKFGRDRPDEILAGEYLLCQGIRFAFDVKHPFRALKGATMELRRLGDIEVRFSSSSSWLLKSTC
jgi:hypothetical protein